VAGARGAHAQEVPSLTVLVVSETGEVVSGAHGSLEGPLSGEAARTKRIALRFGPNGRGSGWIRVGGRYRLRIEALGYETAVDTVRLRPAADAFRRVVLRVRPIALPALLARSLGRRQDRFEGHAVSHITFADEPFAGRGLGEWLAEQSGVSVRRYGASGRQVVTVRGSRPEGVLVLLDGLPLNDPVSGSADLSTVPVATLESATLVRGAASARYGSGALGGVLLLRSRAPSGNRISGGVETGSLGRQAADGQWSAAGKRGSALLSIRRETATNGFEFRNRTLSARPVERRVNADSRGWHGTLSAAPATVFPLRVRLRVDDTERGAPGRIGTRLFDHARWSERDVGGSLQFGVPSARGGTVGIRSQRIAFRMSENLPASVQRATDIQLSGTYVLPGVGGARLSGRLTREAVSGDALSGSPQRWTGGVTFARPVRAGRIRLEPSVGADAAPGEARLSPVLAASLRAGEGWRFWGRIGQAFRLPTFADLYFASAYRIQPNPDLQPERVTLDAEVGIRGELDVGGSHLMLSAVGFRRHTSSPIVWLASTTAVWSPRNLDRLRAWGLEFEGEWRTEAGWLVRGSATLQHSRLGFGTNRNPAPYQPGFFGRLLVQRTFGSRALRVEARLTGSRTTTLAGTRRLPAYAQLDLSARQHLPILRDRLILGLRIDNMLDQNYEVVELFPEPGRTLQLRLETH